MNKIIKILGYFVLLSLAIGLAAYLYIFRQQEIALRLIPNEFEYCGKQITTNNSEYQEIVSLLKANKAGWVMSPVSYVSGQIYGHPAFVINVIQGGVVVSYKTDSGYPQFVKKINHGLSTECKINSEQGALAMP